MKKKKNDDDNNYELVAIIITKGATGRLHWQSPRRPATLARRLGRSRRRRRRRRAAAAGWPRRRRRWGGGVGMGGRQRGGGGGGGEGRVAADVRGVPGERAAGRRGSFLSCYYYY